MVSFEKLSVPGSFNIESSFLQDAAISVIKTKNNRFLNNIYDSQI